VNSCRVRRPKTPEKGEKKLDDGWPESVEEHSERYKYEDLIAWNKNIEIYDDA
jgi:hypothetical protein